MADAPECRRQAAECVRLSGSATVPRTKTLLYNMSRSWSAQWTRLRDTDPDQAKHLAGFCDKSG